MRSRRARRWSRSCLCNKPPSQKLHFEPHSTSTSPCVLFLLRGTSYSCISLFSTCSNEFQLESRGKLVLAQRRDALEERVYLTAPFLISRTSSCCVAVTGPLFPSLCGFNHRAASRPSRQFRAIRKGRSQWPLNVRLRPWRMLPVMNPSIPLTNSSSFVWAAGTRSAGHVTLYSTRARPSWYVFNPLLYREHSLLTPDSSLMRASTRPMTGWLRYPSSTTST